MAKLPFMQFYPADWINDTRSLSAPAKGCWIDILCFMWNSPNRGIWKGTFEQFARVTGIAWETAPMIVRELCANVASATFDDTEVTLECRRMVKEDSAYKNKLNRYSRYRERHKSDAKATDKTLDVISQTSDTINRKDVNTTSPEPQKPAASGPAQTHPWLLGLELYLADPKLMAKIWTVDKAWMKAYPGIDIGMEIKKAHAWELANPERRKKSRIRFFNTWLNRAQDRPRPPGFSSTQGVSNASHGSPSVPGITPLARRISAVQGLRSVGDQTDPGSLLTRLRNSASDAGAAGKPNAGGSDPDGKSLAGL